MKRLTQLSVFLLVWLTGAGAFAAPAVTNLPENRILLFNDYTSSNTTVLLNQPWTLHEGPMPGSGSSLYKALLAGTNHFHRAGWRLLSARGGCAGYLGFSIPQKVPWTTPTYPAVASNLAANLRYESGALVESPVLTNGLGTVYFEAINNLAAYSGQINVEVATNMVNVGTGEVIPTILPPSTNNLELAWATNDVLVLAAATSNDFTRFVKTLNFRGPLKLRIRRTGDLNPAIANPDSAFVVVDNIRLSPPPTDVSVYGLSAFNQAGSFMIRAFVSNADTNVPTDSRTVTAYYRWLNLGPTAWTNSVMELKDAGDGHGDGERYELVLPEQLLGGDLEYYVVCDFGGYMYQSPDYTQLGYAGYAPEGLSPFTASVQTQHLAGADLYTLKVDNGTGGGTYTNGAQVAIAASNLVGQGFTCWTGATQYVANAFSPSTTVSMPNFDITVTATYTNNYYTMTVVNGSGSGVYPYGQAVPIVASNLANKVFDRWAGATQYVDNAFSASAVVTMPATNITLTATYIDLHSLTVNSGSGGGTYTNGQQVVITADDPPVGKMFYRWTVDTAHVASVTSSTTVVTMPAADIVLTATYIDIYTLTVNSGSGSGSSYTNGQLVAISANPPAVGKRFSRWTGDTAYVVNVAASNTFVTMPAASVEVTATYVDIYTLTVTNGFGSGVYTNGEQVVVSANPPAAGKTFACWTGSTQYVADALSPLTTLTMPPLNIGLAATYSNLYYTLTVTGGSGSGTYTNGQSVGISADVPFDKTFERWSGDTAYVASVTSVNTTVTMPALNIKVTALLSSQTSLLSENRFLHFNDYIYSNTTVLLNQPWTLHDGPRPGSGTQVIRALLPGTNHYHRTGWQLYNCRAGSSAYIAGNNFIPPLIPSVVPTYPAVATNLAANLRYDLGAMIVSPAFTNGIGTIYFDAINSDVSLPAQFTVEIATNMHDVVLGTTVPNVIPENTNNLEYVWETLDVQDVSAVSSNDFMRYSRTLNYRSSIVLRIRRSGELNPLVVNADTGFLVIDNIRVPQPPSDVILAKTGAPFEPGFPSVQTNITVRCYVSNADMNVPTDSRTPKVVYRWRFLNQVVLPWRTNTMTYVEGTGDGEGNGELYQTDLSQAPYSEVGDLEYYFLCEFGGYLYLPTDYTGLNYAYPSKNLSPKVFRGDSQGHEFSVRLRPYGSDYDKLYVVADTNRLSTSVFEMKLVGLNEWRGMVPIAGTGLTNLVWRFMGVNAYVPGSGEYSSVTSYWAGVSGITDGRVPYGGQCAVTNASGWLSVLIDEGNYVLLTFSTDTLKYLASRGEYQNFNLWPAPTNTFTESNGQDPKHNFPNTFDAWPVNQDRVFIQAFAGYPSTTNVFVRDPFFTMDPRFVAGSAAYVSERTMVDNTVNAPTNYVKFRNVAMRLKGGDGALGLGYIYNRVETLPDGLKEVTFRTRQGQDVDNYRITYYRDGFTNFNYAIKATARNSNPLSISPHKPSVSLIGYYQDAENFYEYRVTQTNDPNDLAGNVVDKTVLHQLIKWQAGVPYLKANVLQTGISSPPLSSTIIRDDMPLEMSFYNEGAGTRIRCRYASSEKINVLDNSGYYSSGTIGFVSAECAASLSYVRTLGTTAANPYGTGTGLTILHDSTVSGEPDFFSDVQHWYLPVSQYVANGGIAPKGIYSVTPSQQLAIYTQETDYGSDVEPDGVGSTKWKLFKTVTVPGYSYNSVTVSNNSWRSQFVMLQVLGGSADVVVDEVSVTSWHGKLNFDGIGLNPYTYSKWGATESWVVTNATAQANTVYLDHSRADPLEEQAIRSPYIETGLGLMEFDLQVLRPPAELKVQVALGDEDDNWQDVQTFTFATATSWQHISCYLGTNSPGFFRVLNAREGIYSNAWVEIDNVSLWDEPTVTNNSWRAYNVKISSTDTSRVTIDESKACYLNSSQVLDADPVQTHFEPFLRSPELPKGLGKLSFYARAYTNGQAATLYLYASTNGWNAASSNWFEVTHFDNITNGLYKLFTYEPVDGREYNAIQLGTKTGPLDRRVCLDEVTITEPIFPNFDIVNVQLMSMITEGEYYAHPQPVEGEEIHVQAQIDNIQMEPSNIVMYVSYYIGTNAWGVGNWPSGEVVTRRLTNNVPGQPTLYRTVPQGTSGFPYAQTGGIEGLERDQVVQYYVWAEYDGGIHLQAKQKSFVNPSWYFPTDLNALYSQRGWSPYFIVYVVPLNAVWINEVNATDYVEENGTRVYGIWDNAYIEIAVPAWLDLNGWKVDLVTTAAYSTKTITLEGALPEQTAYTNGYAFFVIGDTPSTDPRIPVLPKVDFTYAGLTKSIAAIMPGGVRLRRPQGMYEQASAYDWDPDPAYGISFSGTNWAARDPQKQFVYVGREYDGGSLSVTNGAGKTLADWASIWPWTPGAPNIGQVVPNGDALVPGISNVLITSTLNLLKATQNGKRVNYYSLKMRKGQSTNIVYRTDPWYRLFSVQKDLAEQLPSVGTLTNFVLDLPDLQANVGVTVDVRLRQDLTDMNLDADVLNWILGFVDGNLIPMYYNDRLLTITEQYWLDADPTQSNTFELAISKFEIDPATNFHVTVKMALNGEKKSAFNGQAVLKLQAKNRLLDSSWTMLSQYSLTADSFDVNNTCRVFVSNPFDYVLAGVDPNTLFFRWLIELSDPRVSVHVLTNTPDTP